MISAASLIQGLAALALGKQTAPLEPLALALEDAIFECLTATDCAPYKEMQSGYVVRLNEGIELEPKTIVARLERHDMGRYRTNVPKTPAYAHLRKVMDDISHS